MVDRDRLGEETVVVYRTTSETAAAVAKSLLDEAGIACMIRGGFMSDVTGTTHLGSLFGIGVQPIQLSVLQSDAAQATELLEGAHTGSARATLRRG